MMTFLNLLLALELPHFVTPAIAGLTVGGLVGVVGFLAVVLLVGRGSRRPSRRRAHVPAPLPSEFGARAFRPSTALSARAFAKMGYAADIDEPSGARPAPRQLLPAVTVSRVVVLSAPSDLSFDDSPTEIGETYFDEPLRPRRRTDPPRIRKIVPAAPRFAEQTRGA